MLVSDHNEFSEYNLKYWVTFKEGGKYSYSLNVLDKEGKLTLSRFEPQKVNIGSSIHSPDSAFKVPSFDANQMKINLAYTSIGATLLILILLALWKRNFLLLIAAPLPFIYSEGMTIYHFNGIDVISPTTQFGLPRYGNIDLYFTNLSLTTTGVFYALAIIVIYMVFSIAKENKMHRPT